MNDRLAQFADQKYINLETYKKNGQGVRTPVWFAEDKGMLYFYTGADFAKVKRIRNNPRVQIVPSDARGTPTGTWTEAQARIVDADEAQRGIQLLNQKYGWQKKLIDFFSWLRRRRHAVIAIHI